MTPNTLYNSNPAQSNVGSITTISRMAAAMTWCRPIDPLRQDRRHLELRDNTLLKAQAQIDQFAASMSSALSDDDRRRCRAVIGFAAGRL